MFRWFERVICKQVFLKWSNTVVCLWFCSQLLLKTKNGSRFISTLLKVGRLIWIFSCTSSSINMYLVCKYIVIVVCKLAECLRVCLFVAAMIYDEANYAKWKGIMYNLSRILTPIAQPMFIFYMYQMCLKKRIVWK